MAGRTSHHTAKTCQRACLPTAQRQPSVMTEEEIAQWVTGGCCQWRFVARWTVM
ncbi:MAG: hypothetical protein WC223_13025 [Bacteroidales bacterium]